MVRNLFNSSDFLLTILSIPAYLFFFSFRGYARAWTSQRLGDDTPATNGFLTLNPLKHVNLVGFVCLLLCGIGFGKHIPTNPSNYKNFKKSSALLILSGPASGIIFSFFASLIFFILYYIGTFFNLVYTGQFGFLAYAVAPTSLISEMVNVSSAAVTYTCILIIFMQMVIISISLTIFHLLPLPGFDSYSLITLFLPYKLRFTLYKVEKYNLFIFIGFILLIRLVPQVYSFFIGTPTSTLFDLVTTPFWKIVQLLIK